MRYEPAIKTSRLDILDYYLQEAAKPDAEWSESRVGRLKSPDLKGHSEDDFIYETSRHSFPSIVQKIGRKLDRTKPQCFACHASFDDWRIGLERAHIIASSAEGPDTPANFVLLCSSCHMDAPMTNREDWMLEWVDRGPAAAGWRHTDALEAAIESEMVAVLNYESFGKHYESSREFFKIRVVGADVSREAIRRVFNELADELEADYHFGQPHMSPATSAYLRLEAWARLNLKRSDVVEPT